MDLSFNTSISKEFRSGYFFFERDILLPLLGQREYIDFGSCIFEFE